jgi:hypothetical protein
MQQTSPSALTVDGLLITPELMKRKRQQPRAV